ncbi:MAG: hypothetical protein C0591_08705 [Marinilabiliales bacterium]|nr:MAG: hypothetical protein C0591_08705 [Marinilabiliales bacterium]
MNRILCFFLLGFFSNILTAQTELNSFTSTGSGYSTPTITDYESLGINPANLGWTRNDNSMNIGFFEFGGSIYSEPLTKKEIYSDLYGNPITLDYEGKIDAANAFTNTRMISTASVLLVGFSYQDENIGGFAFNIRQRFTWHSLLNENAANYLFLGYNDIYFDSIVFENGDEAGYSTNPQYATQLYEGSNNHMLMYTEFNFGYGRKVIKKDNIGWYLGVNVKYILGQAMARYYEEESGKLLANSSLSPGFGVVYSGEGVYDGNVNILDGSGLKTVGNGFGFDIGTTLEIKQKLLVGLAVNNIGYIKWKKNVYEGWDGSVWRIDTPGINNYNIFEEGQLINTDNGPPPLDTTIVGISDLKLNLPLHFRGGISYTFNEYVEAGLDTYFPLGEKVPGSFEAPIYSIGARTNPAEWVQLSIGIVSGGKFGTNVPFGATFYPIRNEKNTWEIGIATRDMLTFFKQHNPTVSYAFGFLRFSFGQLKE